MTTPLNKGQEERLSSDTHMVVSKEWVDNLQKQYDWMSKQHADLKRKVERMEIALKAYGISNNMENDWK